MKEDNQMKRFVNLAVVVLFALLLIPAGQAFAQKSLPKVPITLTGPNPWE